LVHQRVCREGRGQHDGETAAPRSGLLNAAGALAYFGEDIDAMIALIDQALALNPSFARGWYLSGVFRGSAGQLDAAVEHVEKALRLSPRARIGWGDGNSRRASYRSWSIDGYGGAETVL
jgi:tetratricopeptide (TPR) repeat protein